MNISSFHKLGKIGNKNSPSYYTTLPRERVEELGRPAGDVLVVKKVGRRLIVEWLAGNKRPNMPKRH